MKSEALLGRAADMSRESDLTASERDARRRAVLLSARDRLGYHGATASK
jgi:hypothetical protein